MYLEFTITITTLWAYILPCHGKRKQVTNFSFWEKCEKQLRPENRSELRVQLSMHKHGFASFCLGIFQYYLDMLLSASAFPPEPHAIITIYIVDCVGLASWTKMIPICHFNLKLDLLPFAMAGQYNYRVFQWKITSGMCISPVHNSVMRIADYQYVLQCSVYTNYAA